MSTGRNGVLTAFAANQRDEVRDLHDVAAALTAQPGMKQQTFVAGITAKGNGDCFLSEERHTALSGGGGMPGQGYPAIFTAAFSAGAGASAGSIGYGEEVSPTLKGTASGNCMGYLPDEYFLMDREWENGREIPKDADIFCTTDYGGNEGVYLDVYLKWYEDSRPVTKSFITGKTLGETGADLDRMFLISSAITKAFHGDGETYARHLRQGERAEPEGMIVHLNPTEQRTIIEALVEQQERQEQAMSQTEQLLRRMTGSITAYMDEVGRYPLHISDYDKTVLAIRDGEFDAFKNLYPRVSDQTDDLLIEVAGRPGVVGGNMTLILLAAVERFSPEAYLTACKRAVETGDSWRVQTLVKESEGRLSEPLPSLHGEVILYAYTNNCRNIAKDLIAQCTPEQIASVPPKLLRWVAEKLDFQTAVDLVDKGVRPGDEVAGILRTLTGQHQEWMAERLLEHGMPVEPDNYDALYACVSNQAVGAAKLLLDRGIDLEQYQLWAEHRPKGDGYTETMEELAAYWSELQNSTQPEDSPMKGMNL